MSSNQSDGPLRLWIIRRFEQVENTLYVALGMLLAVIATIFLVFVTVEFVLHLSSGALVENIINLLGHLLLVLLIVELLYTVQVSYRAGTIVLEPFLFVGMIAVIRRIFVLTAEFTDLHNIDPTTFRHFIIELGTLSVLILVIVTAVLLLRRSALYLQNGGGSPPAANRDR